jgi:hypothetical protein
VTLRRLLASDRVAVEQPFPGVEVLDLDVMTDPLSSPLPHRCSKRPTDPRVDRTAAMLDQR